ncbi:MAG: hypothetical protein HRT94_05550 [Alphaproteobacteria bacterium]|nr:hypothetical protein [Alphaproteobacteria bacterium]
MTAVTDSYNYDAGQLPNKYNWETTQLVTDFDVLDYVELAEELRPHMDAYTTFLAEHLGVNVETQAASTKTFKSASRKLRDETVVWHPERIQDYLRTTIRVPNNGKQSVQDLAKIIKHLRNAPETIGFKDQFTEPEPETGFRSFKLHTLIEDPEDSSKKMSAEIIIQHDGMTDANKITESLRTMERQFRKISANMGTVIGNSSTTQARAQITESAIRGMRKHVHDIAAQKAGLNALITDPKILERHTCSVSEIMDTLSGTISSARHRIETLVNSL